MKLSILPERSRRVGAARSATMAGCLCLLTACVQTGVESAGEQGHAAIPETLAINVGGGAMTTLDGVAYSADESWVIGGEAGKLDAVSGTQSAELYQTYRKGAIKLSIPVPTGEYDVTLKFAEPDDTNMRARIFDVLVEGKVAIPRLNVRLRRDGNLRAGLSQTIPRVQITDGKVDIDFKAHSGEPVLSAVVIRPHAAADTSNFKLKWADEFDVDGKPDPARWNSKNWRAKRVNREDQAYTDRAKNARIKDGKLIIEAHKEDYLGAKYTSARLTSEGHGDLLYGRVEVRAKIPTGGGSWPAIWMYPTDRWRYSGGCDAKVGDPKPGKCVSWPNSGEIDIMEHVGNGLGTVHGTVHNKAYYWVNGKQRKGAVIIDNIGEGFYTYAMNWTPDRIDIFVDDTLYFTYIREEDADWRAWPFDHPFHVILNLAIGGSWGRAAGGIDDRKFPQRLEIDYVRAYEFTGKRGRK